MPDVRPPAVQPPAPSETPISGYEAGRRLRRRMSIAGATCGTVMGFLIGIGGPLIREVLHDPPNVLLGSLIVLLLLAGPWAAWHAWGRRGSLVLLADADDLIKFWLLGGFFMALACACALIVCMVMSRSGSYAERNFTSWMGIELLSILGLVVLGGALDVVRRGKVGAGPTVGAGSMAAHGFGGVAGQRIVHRSVDAAQRRAYVMGGLRLIAIGVGVLVLGVIATYVLSSLLRGSGTAILATGAFAVGLVSIARGLYYVFIRGFIR